jgi:hypothetical protein
MPLFALSNTIATLGQVIDARNFFSLKGAGLTKMKKNPLSTMDYFRGRK